MTLVRVGDGRFDQRRIDVVGARIGLHRHRRGPALADGQPGGDVGVGGHDDFVARPDVHGTQGQVQGIKAVGHADAVGCTAVGSVIGFEGFDFWPADKPAGREDAGDRRINLAPQFAVRCAQIKEWDIHACERARMNSA
jgi:hypothetical protein